MTLDPAFLKRTKQQLLSEQKRLRGELNEIATKKEHGTDEFEAKVPDYGSDEDENAAEVSTYLDRVGIERDLQESLKSVDAALAMIDDGTYGTCEVCGKEISRERLEALPSVTTCAEHAA